MERSLTDTMATIRLAVMQADALVGEMYGFKGLSTGVNDGLVQCMSIFENILEVVNGYEATVPSTARSITKTEGLLGESGLRDRSRGGRPDDSI